ncbi:hypothetical protein OSB04_026339 [Centaurea solstitialis]|uniref:Uncharacterized protein n=1 Tax=Centaurea solstitialis TaxID=347529 RepID=A0AA38SCI2_9ASTR|nr:hypothetical protein OSB04_026339 [Centaurea solstitialis]
MEMLLKGLNLSIESMDSIDKEDYERNRNVSAKKEYPIDVSLPDINDGVYGTDEFRMYMFKAGPEEAPVQLRAVPGVPQGTCLKADSCEYAHGVFESWLHPAQYRTRLCKDETGCARKVCFFAHRVDELRPLYASTGSAVPSPKSGPMETGSMSPPMSPVNGNMWPNKFVHMTPPALQLSGSRLKTSLNARDLEMELQILGLEQRQQLIDDYANTNRFGEMKPTNLDDIYGSIDPSILLSPSGHQQIRQNSNSLRSSYPTTNFPSSPVRKPTGFGFDSSAAVAQAVMNSRSGSFAKQRSQSFIDRGANLRSMSPSPAYSEWGSPDGKLEWGFNCEEAKLRKSASFGFRSGNGGSPPMNGNREPDGSWAGAGLYSSSEKVPQWVEQM